MYQIEDRTGILGVNLPTTFGHLLHHIIWGREYLDWGNVQEDFRHFAVVLQEKLNRMEISPIVEPKENYCGVLHSQKKTDLIFEWECDFNHMLWDALVTYGYAAAENGGNKDFASYSIDLAGDLIRLRVNLEAAKWRRKLQKEN
jgi:hypothetical protein